jgi:hypothetical protein
LPFKLIAATSSSSARSVGFDTVGTKNWALRRPVLGADGVGTSEELGSSRDGRMEP